jgi:hypothetical protein
MRDSGNLQTGDGHFIVAITTRGFILNINITRKQLICIPAVHNLFNKPAAGFLKYQYRI